MMDCTGDAVTGDIVTFTEAVFGGSHRKPKFMGERTVTAEIVGDSYGGGKQQHTFSLRIVASTGHDALSAGAAVRRKARNVYRNGCTRQRWADEAARVAARDEKHERGDGARLDREHRREQEGYYDRA